jgi:hypothetical protein
MKNIIEIVSFKAAPNITPNQLISASKQNQKFVARLRGLNYRTLNFNEEIWTDIIYWGDVNDTTLGCQKFQENPHYQSYVNMMDRESIKIEHQSVCLSAMAISQDGEIFSQLILNRGNNEQS